MTSSTPAPRSPQGIEDSGAGLPADPGAITRVTGIEVGHFTESRRPTGCTVILAREGAVDGGAGADEL